MSNFQLNFKLILFALILTISSCSTNSSNQIIQDSEGDLTVPNITQERNMNDYKYGGLYNCSKLISEEKSAAECKEKIRNFVWENWLAKNRSYLKINDSGTDLAFTEHIFIEPDENGVWGVTLRRVIDHSLPQHSGLTEFRGTVERIEGKTKNTEYNLYVTDEKGTTFLIL